ncbi:hypothetical protein [Candidatus Leptofilum sp.]|uniref:hypothetical protein n=1 Tax=Candidatus Leptofilum sp. TaxID=3241576 RepID=UPI003B5A701E
MNSNQNQPSANIGSASWAVARLRQQHEQLEPPLVNQVVIGSPEIHPRHLSIALAFRDDAALAEAKRKGHFGLLRQDLLKLLAEAGYPTNFLAACFLDFVSETAVNEAGGPWIYFR